MLAKEVITFPLTKIMEIFMFSKMKRGKNENIGI